jgi:hypothetical protein
VSEPGDAFTRALESPGAEVREARYILAGRPVRLRVVGAELGARLHRAFAHLRHDNLSAPAGLTVDLWDEAATGVGYMPNGGPVPPERQWIACGGTLTASPDGRYLSFSYQGSVTVLDRQEQRLTGCRRRDSHLFPSESSKPLVLLLSVWLHDRGVRMLHAGLVARSGAGVLLPGESGTGKSTTSLAAAVQGLEFLGDDFIALERCADGTFAGHSVFSSTCIVRENLSRFPELAAHAVLDPGAEEEKPMLFLSEILPERLRPSVPVRAIALPRIRQECTGIRRATRAEALRALAASTLHTVVPRPGRAALEALGALAERVPAYWLLLGPDLREIGPALERIAAAAASPDAA